MSRTPALLLIFFALAVAPAEAARIGELVELSAWDQAARFLSLRDPTVQLALAGSVLLGLCCGLLGSFLVVRKMALIGDVLSHAVLPGVAAGFLWNLEKDPFAIFVGASVAGLLGTATVNWLTSTTKLKADTAMALVLAVFFAIGLVVIGVIQQLPTAGKSGLDKSLLGQIAGLSARDVKLMAAVAAGVLLLVMVFYKELLVVSFDPVFAQTSGVAARWVQHAFMFLLSASVVVSLQAVGVVLVSAMLVTPAATAYLLTSRMHRMLLISVCVAVFSGVSGAFVSFLGANLPTGPCMVMVASACFGLALAFSPVHGVLPRWARARGRARRAYRENFLKHIYQAAERQGPVQEPVSVAELSETRRFTGQQVASELNRLAEAGLVILDPDRSRARLSDEGEKQAAAVVRNHRLWELYLTEKANYSADRVHDDAEEIEHVLGEENVKRLEQRLGYPERDPHGRSIPRPQ